MEKTASSNFHKKVLQGFEPTSDNRISFKNYNKADEKIFIKYTNGSKIKIVSTDKEGSKGLSNDLLIADRQIQKSKYSIGIDTDEQGIFSFCLGREINGVTEILLSETIYDEEYFKEKVKNLAKYFNATVFR